MSLSPPLTEPPRGFEKNEYQQRLAKAQELMINHQLAGILLTTEHDINYFTGFFTQFWQSPTRPWYVILPNAGMPIAVIPEIGVNCMANGWVSDIRSWSSPHASDDGVSLLLEALYETINKSQATFGKSHSYIGINKGRETYVRMPINDFEKVSQGLANQTTRSEFKDATAIIRNLRMVKSSAEIDKLLYVAQTVSGVFENLFEFVSVGMTDSEIFKLFKLRCMSAGVDDVPYLVGAADRDGYDDIISPPAGRVLRERDVLILDTGCTFDGYYCDFDRNYAFGSVDDLTKKAYSTVWQATEAGFEAAKPGNRCVDLFTAMDGVMQRNGALGESVGRYGHGLGLQLTEPPSHTAWDDTLLSEGMVLTLEPGMIYAPGKIMVHEENIVITANGAEFLSRRAAPEIQVKP